MSVLIVVHISKHVVWAFNLSMYTSVVWEKGRCPVLRSTILEIQFQSISVYLKAVQLKRSFTLTNLLQYSKVVLLQLQDGPAPFTLKNFLTEKSWLVAQIVDLLDQRAEGAIMKCNFL